MEAQEQVKEANALSLNSLKGKGKTPRPHQGRQIEDTGMERKRREIIGPRVCTIKFKNDEEASSTVPQGYLAGGTYECSPSFANEQVALGKAKLVQKPETWPERDKRTGRDGPHPFRTFDRAIRGPGDRRVMPGDKGGKGRKDKGGKG